MKWLKRWLNELFHPQQKCWRVGCNVHDYRVKVLIRPAVEDRSHWVAESCRGTIKMCARCGVQMINMSDWKPTRTNLVNGLSMDSNQWDDFERDGFLITEKVKM